jgi:hypothetical protein
VADQLTYYPHQSQGNCLHLHRQAPWS